MTIDDGIEKIIGPFGKYQTFIFILITIGRYPIEFQLSNVVFILPSVNYVCKDDDAYNLTNHCPCQNPEYDRSTIVSSVTSEFNLICDRTWLASLAQSMLQVGVLAGSMPYGYFSDRFGRKISALLALFLTALFSALSAVVTELWMFLLFRFLIGTSVGGSMLCAYILVFEICGKSFRPYMVGIHETSFITGYFFLAVIANFVREWRHLQLVTSVPWLLLIVYYWIIPESPRWLITVGRREQAIDILTKIAKRNNKPTKNIETIVKEIEKQSRNDNQQKHGTYLDLFRTPKIRRYSIVVALIWLSCAHTYFGVNQSIGNLQGNLYINVMLSAVSLIPGIVLVTLASLYLKRKVSIITSFIVAAVSLFIIIFIPENEENIILAFAIIGLTGAYTSFVQIYLYTTEIFPTIVRNSAMGFASVFARFGGFMAPFIVNIGVQSISLAIFGGLAAFAAILCLFLPETKGIVLLNTIMETEGRQI